MADVTVTTPAPGQDRTIVAVARANPHYQPDAALISVSATGDPDAVTAALARHLGENGSVYLQLPDGRMTIVLDLDGMTWIPRTGDEGLPA